MNVCMNSDIAPFRAYVCMNFCWYCSFPGVCLCEVFYLLCWEGLNLEVCPSILRTSCV